MCQGSQPVLPIGANSPCCGSGMCIPDPRSKFFPFPDPGSKIFRIWICLKEFKYFNPNCFLALRNMIRDVHSGSRIRIRIFHIPYPIHGSKKHKKAQDPGSRILIRNTTKSLPNYSLLPPLLNI